MVVVLMAAIHPSVWNRNSPKFAFIRFSEARYVKRRSRGSIQLHCVPPVRGAPTLAAARILATRQKITHLRYAAGLSSVLHYVHC
jgi:hypothetical protein